MTPEGKAEQVALACYVALEVDPAVEILYRRDGRVQLWRDGELVFTFVGADRTLVEQCLEYYADARQLQAGEVAVN